MADALVVHGLGKKFRRYLGSRPTTLKEALLRGWREIRPSGFFWALREVSFNLTRGRILGIIGVNGAGKSTLLQLIGGVLRPDEGGVQVQGHIRSLIDLGVGFHPDLTGRENVFISGVTRGFTRREMAARFDAIVSFAEVEDFIDSPLRIYSTGMWMRLAFAVAAHTEPDILLIDEILAVGDVAFQEKCIGQIGRFKERGCTIVLISHDAGLIRRLCDKALWLREGRMAAYGATEEVLGEYASSANRETRRRTPACHPPLTTPGGVELRVHENRFGSMEVEIVGVRLLGPDGLAVGEIHSGEPLCVEIEYRSPGSVGAPVFGVTVAREDGLLCLDTNTAKLGLTLPARQAEGCLRLHFERLDLSGGLYYLDVGVYRSDWAYAYDYHWHVYPLTIQGGDAKKSILDAPHRWIFMASKADRS